MDERLSLDEDRFVGLLGRLVAETPHLMNAPPLGLVPQESLAARHVLDLLRPLSTECGGPLVVTEVQNVPGRSNVVVEYPSAHPSNKCVSFVGAHLDVVHADPKNWTFDPFTLGRVPLPDGDVKLTGRGTTDCLGHCALLTELFVQLGTQRPELSVSVFGVWIADEEVGEDPSVGVCGLMKRGLLDRLGRGPVLWVDCADCQPNIGSGGTCVFTLTAHGKGGHSGFPHKAVNAIELAHDALRYVQGRFYADFPTHPKEKVYGFPCSSSLKATATKAPEGALNAIKATCELSGDVRIVPFYRIEKVKEAVEGYVRDLNQERFAQLRPLGPSSYSAADAKVTLRWHGPGVNGLACSLDSDGFKFLSEATKHYFGHCTPLADTGSLPLVAELQDFGWDVQTIGFGIEDSYHADDEFARLLDFKRGFKVLLRVVDQMHKKFA